MYLFVPCDKKSHGTEISFPIRSNRLSHPMKLINLIKTAVQVYHHLKLYRQREEKT